MPHWCTCGNFTLGPWAKCDWCTHRMCWINSSSAKSDVGFPNWSPNFEPSPRFPQTISETYSHSSTTVRGVQWCDRIVLTLQQLVQSFNVIHCTCFFHVGPLDFNCVTGFLNCFNDFKNILNCLIPWDIDYTQACTTPMTRLSHSE